MNTLKNFSEWVKMRRSELKLTQQQLADETGLGRTYITNLERGRIRFPQYDTRQKFHQVFGSSDTELVEYGIAEFTGYGGEMVPVDHEEPPQAVSVPSEDLTFEVSVPGLKNLKGGPYALLGAALVYSFRAMGYEQRVAVLQELEKIHKELQRSIDDVPF